MMPTTGTDKIRNGEKKQIPISLMQSNYWFLHLFIIYLIYICDLPLCMSESYVCTVPVEAEAVFRFLWLELVVVVSH